MKPAAILLLYLVFLFTKNLAAQVPVFTCTNYGVANNTSSLLNKFNFKKQHLLQNNYYQDGLGNYWIWGINKQKGLIKYDKDLKQLNIVAQSFKTINTVCIVGDSLFVGTNEGLYMIAYGKRKLLPLLTQTHAIGNEKIMLIASCIQGLYIATNKAVYLYEWNNKFTIILTLQHAQVSFIKPDENNSVWVGTNGGGLYLLRNNKLNDFTGLNVSLAYVHAIIEDKNKNLWVLTNNGFLVVNKAALLLHADFKVEPPFFYHIAEKSVFSNSLFSGKKMNPFTRIADGSLQISCLNGLVSFIPDSVKFDFSASAIIVNKIMLDTLSVNPAKAIIKVSEKINIISLFISTLFGKNKENEQVDYQLIKAENNFIPSKWIPVNGAEKITILTPDYGSYKIGLRRRIGLKTGDFFYKTINIYVAQKWYKQGLFYTFIGLIFSLVVFTIYIARQHYLIHQRKRVKKQIQHATQQLSDENKALHFQNKTKSTLISIFTHDISVPLQYIQLALKHKAEALEFGTSIKADITEIFLSTQSLLCMSNNILDWVKVQEQNEQLKIVKTAVNLKEIVEEKCFLLLTIAAKKKIVITTIIPPDFEVYSDKNILGIILYNVFNNAVKFTSSGTITIEVATIKNRAIIYIKDTGKGMSAEKLFQLKNMLSLKSEKGTHNEEGKGMGLLLIKELAALVDIKVCIKSTVAVGSTIALLLPN